MTTTTSRYASLNMRNTAEPFPITPAMATAGLHRVLDHTDIIGLQEWAGTARNQILRDLGTLNRVAPTSHWLRLTPAWTPNPGWSWVRPLLGGPTIGVRADRYEIRWVKAKLLALPGRVDKVPGYRSLLGPSYATVVAVHDHTLATDEVIVDYHLTTHVETRGQYRPEVPKRVARHKTERAALEAVIAHHKLAGRRVTTIGDGNYHDLELAGVRSCYAGGAGTGVTGGTLGHRRVDIVHSTGGFASSVVILGSASDHRHPIATYDRPRP